MAATFTIGEVAARSGFAASTLRYYDDIGLVCPAGRTAAGYRIYDEHTLERLGFVARAKELGCTIDEIRDLLVAWDGGRCGPVQDRLRRLVSEKIDAAATHVVESETLLADLRRSASALERHRPVGACDDSCGCAGSSPEAPLAAVVDWVEIGAVPHVACSLEPDDMADRIADWRLLLENATRRVGLEDGLRIEFGPSSPSGELMRLVTAEQSCCTFFRFAVTVDERGLTLEVRAAPEAMGVVDELFGRPSVAAGGQ